MSAVETYIERHGCDPTCLIEDAHMSDEASGPEDEDEGKDEWKLRMAVECGLISDADSDVDLDNIHFRELIKPAWRSKEVRFNYHLNRIIFNSPVC